MALGMTGSTDPNQNDENDEKNNFDENKENNCYGTRHEGVQRPKRKWRKQQFWRPLQKLLSAMSWSMRGSNPGCIAECNDMMYWSPQSPLGKCSI